MKLFSFLLIVLGFSACNNDEEQPVEYGTPTVQFSVKGKVVHAADKEKGLPDIQVIVDPFPGEEMYSPLVDTVYTDGTGGFEVNSVVGRVPDKIRISYKELEENAGEVPLKSGEIEVTTLEQTEAGSGWYKGKYEAEVTIEMEEDPGTDPE